MNTKNEGTNKLITDFKICTKTFSCEEYKLQEKLHNSQFKCKSLKNKNKKEILPETLQEAS